jgi:hypothetical protein
MQVDLLYCSCGQSTFKMQKTHCVQPTQLSAKRVKNKSLSVLRRNYLLKNFKMLDSCVVLMLSSPCEIGVPGPGAVCVPPLVPQLHSHPLLPLHLTQVSEMTAFKRKAHYNTEKLVQKLGTLLVFPTIHALCWIQILSSKSLRIRIPPTLLWPKKKK